MTMYESPIQQFIGQMQSKMESELLYRVEQTVGYHIDKDELIKALEYDRDQYHKGYSDGQNADKWISVSDRLPGNYEEVLVYETDMGIIIGWYSANSREWKSESGSRLDVTHWQPLPQMPREAIIIPEEE